MNSLLISLANPKAVFRSFHVLKGDLESHMIWRLLILKQTMTVISYLDNTQSFLHDNFIFIFSQSIFSL